MTYKLHSACIGRDDAIAKILDVHKIFGICTITYMQTYVGMLMHLNYIYILFCEYIRLFTRYICVVYNNN